MQDNFKILPGEIPFPSEVDPPREEFYNTIRETGPTLEQRRDEAKKQRQLVFEYFKKHPKGKFTPFEVHEGLKLHETKTPVSSIRRAMTNLTQKDGSGVLIKLEEQKMERLGANNFLWQLNENYKENGRGKF